MLTDLRSSVCFGFGDVQEARVGFSFKRVRWVRAGIRLVVRAAGGLGFLNRTGCVPGAHFGFGQVRGGNEGLVVGGLLLWRFTGTLR